MTTFVQVKQTKHTNKQAFCRNTKTMENLESGLIDTVTVLQAKESEAKVLKGRYSDKELLKIAKDSNLRGTFKLIRSELLMNEELDIIHRSILEATKNTSIVYQFIINNCQKYGKEKTIFGRLAILRALNKHETTLQNLIAESLATKTA
jgi:hypothetical protein